MSAATLLPGSIWTRAFRGMSGHRRSTAGHGDQQPIRAELFGIERLEQHAESLAAAQHVASRRNGDHRLERRLKDNERALRHCYATMIAAARDARSITPAADWL